jgi:hypothetical protein
MKNLSLNRETLRQLTADQALDINAAGRPGRNSDACPSALNTCRCNHNSDACPTALYTCHL